MKTQVEALIGSISAIDERIEKLRDIWGKYIHTINSATEFPISARANFDTGQLRFSPAGLCGYAEFKLKDGKGIICYGVINVVDGGDVSEETLSIAFDDTGKVVSEPKEFENITEPSSAKYFHLKAVHDLCRRIAGEPRQ